MPSLPYSYVLKSLLPVLLCLNRRWFAPQLLGFSTILPSFLLQIHLSKRHYCTYEKGSKKIGGMLLFHSNHQKQHQKFLVKLSHIHLLKLQKPHFLNEINYRKTHHFVSLYISFPWWNFREVQQQKLNRLLISDHFFSSMLIFAQNMDSTNFHDKQV